MTITPPAPKPPPPDPGIENVDIPAVYYIAAIFMILFIIGIILIARS